MVLDMLDPPGIVLDLLTWESFDNFVPNWGNLEMFFSFERFFFFFYIYFLLLMTKLHIV